MIVLVFHNKEFPASSYEYINKQIITKHIEKLN